MLLDLNGKKALITGVANRQSLAWSIARQLHKAGATLGFTFLCDERERYEQKVREAIEPFPYSFLLPCDIADDAQIQATFETVKEKWGQVDILIYSLAFSSNEGISRDFSDASRKCFAEAREITDYSLVSAYCLVAMTKFVALVEAAKPLITDGGSIITISYLDDIEVVSDDNLMQACKAALGANIRDLAAELTPRNIRVNAISAGPSPTLAASGITGFSDMKYQVEEVAPPQRSTNHIEVGNTAAFLSSNLASGITGQVIDVDDGYSILGFEKRVRN